MALLGPSLGTLVNIVVLLVGAAAGYYFGVKLLRKRLQEDGDSRKCAVVESLLSELRLHKGNLETHPRYELIQNDEVRVQSFAVYPDDTFKASISDDSFHQLSIELQRMLIEHYHRCDMINAFQRESNFSLQSPKEINYHITMINRYLASLKPDEVVDALLSELEV